MQRLRPWITALALIALAPLAAQALDDTDVLLEPVETRRCLVEGTFSCQEYEYSYSVRGITCTENCLASSGLNRCQLCNRCHWDPASGCFRKEVCMEVSSMQTCRRWETRAVCR